MTSGSSQNTQLLILNVGYALGLDYFNCNTGANDNKIKNALQSFGYSYTNSSHDATTVLNELVNYQRPVSMGGFDNSILGIPCGNGHQWVCDGVDNYVNHFYYFVEFQHYDSGYYDYGYYGSGSPNTPNPNIFYSPVYFHMNWGWGSYLDGWYVNNTFPSGNVFQYGRTNFYIWH